MQPRQMRDTSRPVRPSLLYSMSVPPAKDGQLATASPLAPPMMIATFQSFNARCGIVFLFRRPGRPIACGFSTKVLPTAISKDTAFGLGSAFIIRSALLRTRHAPDHIAHVVRHQHGTVRTDRDANRPAIGHALV